MNPRVSRSSALASKATGFPIARSRPNWRRIQRRIPNDITRKPRPFEPTIDYVVTKIPKWAFEKFPGAEDVLGTQMNGRRGDGDRPDRQGIAVQGAAPLEAVNRAGSRACPTTSSSANWQDLIRSGFLYYIRPAKRLFDRRSASFDADRPLVLEQKRSYARAKAH